MTTPIMQDQDLARGRLNAMLRLPGPVDWLKHQRHETAIYTDL
jgi:hypothetical protein